MTDKKAAARQAKYRKNMASKGKMEIRYVISSEIAEQLCKAIEKGDTVEGIIKKGLKSGKKPKVTRDVNKSVIVPKRNLIGQVIKE